MLIDRLDDVLTQVLVVDGLDIWLVQFTAVDVNLSASYLDRFARKADNTLDVAFVGIARVPKHNYVAAFQVAPAYTSPFVVNEFVDEQPLTIVQLRQHRCAFDHNRLDRKNAEQNKNDDDQKNISDKPQTLKPKTLPRLSAYMNNINVRVIRRRDHPEVDLVFFAELEHTVERPDAVKHCLYARYTILEVTIGRRVCQSFFIYPAACAAVCTTLMDDKIRSLFPALANCNYLNSAAVSPIPTTAIDAINTQLTDVSVNGSKNFGEWIAVKDGARKLIGEMLGVQLDQIAFMRNTSDGFASIANGLDWQTGDNIVSYEHEFPANFYPWRMVRDRFGVDLRLCPGQNGRIDLDEFVALIDKNTKLVTISSVQYTSGFRADLEQIGRAARAVDALFAVDIIQGFGAFGFDLPAQFVDIAAGASHKWLCAPEGCGILYVSDRARERVQPTFVGWVSVETPWDFADRDQPLKPNALAWESGTGASALFYGLEASLKLLKEVGLERIDAYLEELTDDLCERLAGKDYEIVSSRRPGEKSAIVCVKHRGGLDCEAIAKRLADDNIIVSPRNDILRIAPHFYNNVTDIDRLIAALP